MSSIRDVLLSMFFTIVSSVAGFFLMTKNDVDPTPINVLIYAILFYGAYLAGALL